MGNYNKNSASSLGLLLQFKVIHEQIRAVGTSSLGLMGTSSLGLKPIVILPLIITYTTNKQIVVF